MLVCCQALPSSLLTMLDSLLVYGLFALKRRLAAGTDRLHRAMMDARPHRRAR